MKMQIITSKDNEIIKSIRKLKERKYREQENEYIIEGIKLIEEAIQEKVEISKIVICDECMKENKIDTKIMYEIARYDCFSVPEKVFKTITDVNTPQGILAVLKKKTEENKKIDYSEEVILALDNIQDPGNLGTILRTVDSVGLKQIIVSKGSVDPFSPKVVRSTMGAIFRLNIIEVENIEELLKECKENNFKVVATSLNTKESIYDVKYNKTVIVIGNEANGVSKEVLSLSNKKVKIPMLGKTESLNASVATGVILYEYVRQKLSK